MSSITETELAVRITEVEKMNEDQETHETQETADPEPEPQDVQYDNFRMRNRRSLWTGSDDDLQSHLNKSASFNLHFSQTHPISPEELISALNRYGTSADDVKALRRAAQPGVYTLTFKNDVLKERFLLLPSFECCGNAGLIQDAETPLTFVSICHAPPELPHAAVIARLRSFGDVISFRRCLHTNSTIENGNRTARMRLRCSIPSYLRIASESLLILYENQSCTCRRCNIFGHIARECNSYACYNCNQLGHVASACTDYVRCSICKSIAHRASSCPFAVIDDLNTNLPINAVLADAVATIAHVRLSHVIILITTLFIYLLILVPFVIVDRVFGV